MFKTRIKSFKPARAPLACVLLVSLCISPSLTHAATNPADTTISGMNASTLGDPILENLGTIMGGIEYSTDRKVGMYGNVSGNVDYIFTNKGSISIESLSTVSSGAIADTYSYGMYVRSTPGNHSLTNHGNIQLYAKGGTASGDGSGGNMSVDAIATTSGMYTFAAGNHRLSNYGSITATSQGGTATSNSGYQAFGAAEANGIYTNGSGNHSLSNYGSIIVTAQGGTAHSNNSSYNANAHAAAFGMRTEGTGTGNHSLSNYGNILAIAKGGQITSATAGELFGRAYGMYATGTGNHSLSNYGSIVATATGSTTAGSGSGAKGQAYGMYVLGSSVAGGEHVLHNYGTITATATAVAGLAQHAFEAYGFNSYSVGTWAMPLRHWSAGGLIADTVFGVRNTQTLHFKNSTLILRPGTASQGFAFGKDYAVADMIAVEDDFTNTLRTGSTLTANDVTGNIAAAIAEVPFLKATLHNGHDPLTATLRLDSNISAETTPTAMAAQGNLALVQGQMSHLAKQLLQTTYTEIYTQLVAASDASGLGAGSPAPKHAHPWQIFMTPYANTLQNSHYDFNGNNMGVSAGASYKVSDSFSFGAHLDFNATNYYTDMLDMSSKASSFALGLHGTYKFTPQWYVRGQLTGALNQTDSTYTLSSSLAHADTKHHGHALYAALNTGYVWLLAPGHSLTPEIGLSYLTTHSSAYDIAWGNASSMYDMKYDATSYNALYGNINLHWRSEWQLQNEDSIALRAGLGLRQNLGNNAIESKLQTLGSSFAIKSSEDMTTWLADVGLSYTKGIFSVSLSYDGSYGTRQEVHGGNVTVKLDF